MSKKTKQLQQDEVKDQHPSQDNTYRFALDTLLRNRGFHIYSRPKKGPTLWIRGKKIMTHWTALQTVSEDLRAQAEQDELNYYKGVKQHGKMDLAKIGSHS